MFPSNEGVHLDAVDIYKLQLAPAVKLWPKKVTPGHLSPYNIGSFHLMHMMLTEYAFLVLESQQDQHQHTDMVNHVQRNMKQTGK